MLKMSMHFSGRITNSFFMFLKQCSLDTSSFFDSLRDFYKKMDKFLNCFINPITVYDKEDSQNFFSFKVHFPSEQYPIVKDYLLLQRQKRLPSYLRNTCSYDDKKSSGCSGQPWTCRAEDDSKVCKDCRAFEFRHRRANSFCDF